MTEKRLPCYENVGQWRPTEASRQATLLIVDDEPMNVLLLEDMLRQAGFQAVHATTDPRQALPLARSLGPDLVLLDLMMPHMDGIAVMGQLRDEWPQGANVPVLALTADVSAQTKHRALQKGAKDFLTKPFDAVELFLRIENLLETRFLYRDLRRQNHSLEERVQTHSTELNWAIQAMTDENSLRRSAEEEMHRMLAQTEQMLASIPSILVGLDENGLIMTWNAMSERAFGRTKSEAFDRRLDELGLDWDWPRIEAAMELCRRERKTVRIEDVAYVDGAGRDGFLGISINAVLSHEQGEIGLLLIAADVTERRRTEAQLAHRQKLESIGQLAAGIAHEINTPIQYVGDNTRFLRDSLDDLRPLLDAYGTLARAAEAGTPPTDIVAAVQAAERAADVAYLLEEIPPAISQSLEGIERVAHIVRAMKDFSHPGTTTKVATDLNRALESTATVARNEWKYVAELATDFQLDLPPVPCFPADLNQVFLNMIVNAAHAIADVVGDGAARKGTITIGTRRVGAGIEVWIGDTGAGMTEAIKARIFDPFFTTKPPGSGTGQGLAISHSVVVEKHGGAIAVESTLGVGTTFTITLPLTDERAAGAA